MKKILSVLMVTLSVISCQKEQELSPELNLCNETPTEMYMQSPLTVHWQIWRRLWMREMTMKPDR